MGAGVEEWGGGIWAAADLVTPMAVRVAATLRLADHIASGRASVEALVEVVDADQDALRRVMEHLVAVGVFTRSSDGTFGLTKLGEQLQDDDPLGVRPWLDLEGAVGRAELSFVELLHTVRTGRPAFPRFFGRPFWEDLSADAKLAASFDALMGSRLVAEAPLVAEAYPWGSLRHVVDVGGGNGSMLIAILRAHEGLRGTVLDLEGPVARAQQAFAAAGLSDRADATVGSFFDELPAGAGGYVLSGVLHDWDDPQALSILRRCAEAASDTGKVLVVDHLGDHLSGVSDTQGDLRMLCYVRGRERGIDQLRDLAAEAGLRVGQIAPAGTRSVIEMLPAH
ncbi:methyltransferase [Actinomadura rupiterrae]|uniref:methyltransferase n=1 Tax=Actinomadura rupiterrae TaxID=559627 RepID=UPI0020A2735F|nr:methyltransferase [Actinomadura rupiterrae]MCP2339444.1 hypothetical protein [Actinomadura rupiterrae]